MGLKCVVRGLLETTIEMHICAKMAWKMLATNSV
jgi:hypothetical protein